MLLSILAGASALMVTPANINRVLATAPAGAVIRLAPGEYGTVNIRKRHWRKPVTIEAGKARLTLNVAESSGLIVRGGTFVGGSEKTLVSYAVTLRSSHKITMDRFSVTDSALGISIRASSDIRISHADIVGMQADGIDIASSQHVTIADSSCTGFKTTFGQAIHPDCVQMWSTPDEGVTQDITLERNRAVGVMQGFSGFSHVRSGVDDGGFDRIIIQDNYAATAYPHGVHVNNCRNCVITGNTVETLPGSRWQTWVRASNCMNCKIENNTETPSISKQNEAVTK